MNLRWELGESETAKAVVLAAVAAPSAPETAIKSGWGRESRLVMHHSARYFVKTESLSGPLLKGFVRKLLPRTARIVGEAAMQRRAHDAGAPVPRPLALALADGNWIFVSEWAPGEQLKAAYLASGRELRFPREAAHALIAGLAKLHAAGIAHGDLHYGNIIIDRQRVWIVDFALAREIAANDVAAGLADLAELGRSLHEKIRRFTALRWLVLYLRERGVGDKASRKRLAGEVNRLYRSQPFKRSGPDVWFLG